MSYILEALKKAQAERQLGNAPTIHAVPIQAPPAARGAAPRLPVYVTLALCAALLSAGGIYWWRQDAPAAPVVVVQAQAPPPVVLAAPAPSMQVAPQAAAPAPAPLLAGPAPAPVAAAPVQVPQKLRAAPPVHVPAPLEPAAPASAARTSSPEPAAIAAPEENLPFMRELPEQQRSGLPQVALGGYMYSRNPADRLILIDKVLRHEGEEVAPGLVLEKLLPKAAVMNYRGTRYRIAY